MMNKRLGNVLKGFRRRSGYTQQQLADMLSVSRPTYIKWEKNVGSPDFFHVYLLLQAYNITFEDFIQELIEI